MLSHQQCGSYVRRDRDALVSTHRDVIVLGCCTRTGSWQVDEPRTRCQSFTWAINAFPNKGCVSQEGLNLSFLREVVNVTFVKLDDHAACHVCAVFEHWLPVFVTHACARITLVTHLIFCCTERTDMPTLCSFNTATNEDSCDDNRALPNVCLLIPHLDGTLGMQPRLPQCSEWSFVAAVSPLLLSNNHSLASASWE